MPPLVSLDPCSTVVGIRCKDGVVLVSGHLRSWLRTSPPLGGSRWACAAPSTSPAPLAPRALPAQGAEKLIISKMLVENSNRRTFPVDRHAGVATAGVAADGRSIVSRAMSEANQYKSFYGDPIPGHVLAERLGSYVHVFNLYWCGAPT